MDPMSGQFQISISPDLQTKESELSSAIVNAIRASQSYCKPINESEQGKIILKLCKETIQEAIEMRKIIHAMRRPYIMYFKELEELCKKIKDHLGRVSVLVSQAISDPPTEIQRSLDNCNMLFDKANSTIIEFVVWIYSAMNSYLLQQSDSLIDIPVPEDKDLYRTDILRCPKWILRQLYEARQVQAHIYGIATDSTEYFSTTSKANIEELKNLRLRVEEQALSLKNMENRLRDLSENNNNLQEENISLNQQVEKLQEENISLNQQVDILQQQMEQQKTQLDQQNTQLDQIPKLDSKVKILKTELSKRMENEKVIREKLAQTIEQTKRREKEFSVTQKQLKHYQTLFSEIEKKIGPHQTLQSSGNTHDVHIITELQQMLDANTKDLETITIPPSDHHDQQHQHHLHNTQILEEETSPIKEVSFNVASVWMTEFDKRQSLAQVLLDSSHDYDIIALLGKLFPIGNDADTCVRSILELYQSQNRAMELIQTMIDWEVKTTKSPIQLFRGEEFPARMIRAYTRMLGIDFAQKTIGDLINEILDNQISIELDDNPEMQTRPPTEEDKHTLDYYSQRFIEAILESLPNMPLEFIRIANYLTKQVKSRFPDPEATQAAVAGFIFLRFFCPCIASPETFEFRDVKGMEIRRSFLLIGKVLQSLANGALTFKEKYLNCMVPFLERNKIPMDQFIRNIRVWPPKINGDNIYLIKAEILIHKKKGALKPLLQDGQFETSQTVWKQYVTSPPHIRIKEMLNKIERQAISTPLFQNFSPPSRADRKTKKDTEARNVSKINRGKFPNEKNNPLLQGILVTYIDTDMCIPGVVTKSLIPKLKDGGSPLLTEICSALGNIWAASNAFGDVIYSVITTEISSSDLSSYEFLHNSFSKNMFVWYTKNYAVKWLADCWGNNITTMIEQNLYLEIDEDEAIEDESGNKPNIAPATIAENKEKLKNFCKYFVDQALGALKKCPVHLYDFATILNDCLGTEVQTAFQFLFINFFALALEDPDGYQLTTKKPSKHARRTLAILAEMMINLAKGSEKLIKDIVLDQAERNEYVYYVESWASGNNQDLELKDIDHNIEWTKERQSLMNITDYIIENEEAIENDLKMVGFELQPTICYSYTLNELLDSLDPPSELKEEKKAKLQSPIRPISTREKNAVPNSTESTSKVNIIKAKNLFKTRKPKK